MAGGGGNDEATSFDLTALLDILSNIIFFLMAGFGAAVVAMVPATVPSISEAGDNDTAKELDKVTVTMTLATDGAVKITAANQDMLPEELAPYARSIAGKNGAIDAQAINDHLWSIKEKFRKSTNMVLVPDGKVKYAMLIEAMDAARERPMEVEGEKVSPELFPAVVVSSKAQ